MLRVCLFAIILTLALGEGEITQLMLGDRKYEGFIYPYVITSSFNDKKLYLVKVTNSRLMLGPIDPSVALEPHYSRLPDNIVIPIDHIDYLKIYKACIHLRNQTEVDGKQRLYVRNPHQYLYYSPNDNQDTKSNFSQLNYFKGPFELRDQQLFVLSTHAHKRSELYFFEVEELWRDFINVYVFQEQNYFSIFLTKHITHESSQLETSRYVKRFFFDSEIKGIQLVKNTIIDVLNLVIHSGTNYCVFHLSKDLSVGFNGCSKRFKQDMYIREIYHFDKDYILVHSGSIQVNQTSDRSEKQVELIRIVNVSPKSPAQSCFFKYINDKITYIGVLENIAAVCTKYLCRFYTTKCKVAHEDYGIQKGAIIEKMDLIRFNVKRKHNQQYRRYISQLIVTTNLYTSTMIFCIYGELSEGMDDLSVGQYLYGGKYCVEFSETAETNKCDNLSCSACSLVSFCYFQYNKCKLIVNKPISLFTPQQYAIQHDFQQSYARYLYGETSHCQNRNFSCSYVQTFARISISIEISGVPSPSDYCTIFVLKDKEMEYRLQNPINPNFSIKAFQNSYYKQHSASGLISTRYDSMRTNYLLFYIFDKRTNNTEIRSESARRQQTYSLINVQQERIYQATKLFTIVFGSFLIVTIFFITCILLKNKIKARLALWGFITFTPSGIYPLSEIELKLKIRELTKKGFLMEYAYERRDGPKVQNTSLEQCSFCLQEFSKDDVVFEIYCRHKYHKSCLGDWIRKERNSQKCPICKRGFTQAELLRFNQSSYSYGLNQEANLANAS